ncbi:MAG: hypothetical protein AAFN76_00020 [Pseudomonadota bacterium]
MDGAVLRVSALPVGCDDLARLVGQAPLVEMAFDDINEELIGRPYELEQVAGGWMFWTRTQLANSVNAAADMGHQSLDFSAMKMVWCFAPSPIISRSTGWPRRHLRKRGQL